MKNNSPRKFETIKMLDVYHVVREHDSVPHWHSGYLMTLVDGGNGVETKNGVEYPIQKGKLTVMSPSDIHANRIGDAGYFSYFGATFRTELYKGIGGSVFSRVDFPLTAYLEGEEYADMVYLFRMLEKYAQKPMDDVGPIVTALLEILLKTAESKKVGTNTGESSTSISEAVSYLKAHFTEDISQGRLAAMCGFSVGYFGRLFKQETGVSFSDYVISLRLDCAARLLLAGANAQEACYSSGFSSFNWFSEAFKRKYHVSPGRYAKEHRND